MKTYVFYTNLLLTFVSIFAVYHTAQTKLSSAPFVVVFVGFGLAGLWRAGAEVK